ncbi:MAG: molybdopterin cofactor-binding domain-containing protein, partial [Burkholderiaceae bacterium]
MSFPDYDPSRRKFLIGGLGVAGALVVGWTLLPPRQRLHASPPVNWPDQHYALNGWVSVAIDGRVTVMLTKSEMGQGVMTSLAMLVADELDVPLSSVDMVQAPLRAIYGDTSMAADGLPFHPDDQGLLKRGAQWISRKLMRELGLMVTGGSSSVKDSWLPMREAGAAARARLVAAAARAWGVPEAECSTEQGRVTHSSGRSAGYGELAPSAAAIGDVPYTLKPSSAFALIGTPAARLDVPAKVNGSAQFGLDVRLEGMRYAALSMCPVFGGTLKSFDGSEVEKLPGVVRVMALNSDSSGAGDAVAVV